jgi:hypothetical protein
MDGAKLRGQDRLVRVLVCFALLMLGCDRDGTKADPTPNVAPRAPLRSGDELLVGTWEVDGFEASSPETAGSVAALQAQVDSPEARSVRIAYSKTDVRILVPGQPTISSPYEVLDKRSGFIHFKSGPDKVTITFRDDDHMVVDRANNPFGAKMKMKRSTLLPGSSASIVTGLPMGSVRVVGTNSAGHQIVKIGP